MDRIDDIVNDNSSGFASPRHWRSVLAISNAAFIRLEEADNVEFVCEDPYEITSMLAVKP